MGNWGRLYVFEGPDGVGKSTLSSHLVSYLQRAGRLVYHLSFPGKAEGTLGKLVYGLHHGSTELSVKSMTESSRQLLHVAAHVDAIEDRIIPALDADQDVVLDRFWWSTWVYGRAFGVDPKVLELMINLEKAVWGDYLPAKVFLITRSQPLGGKTTKTFHDNIATTYEALASSDGSKYPILRVNNEASVDDARRIIESAVPLQCQSPESSYRLEANAGPSLPFEPSLGKRSGPTILTLSLPAKPTQVFQTFWEFAVKRQEIFFKRVASYPPPWTDDPILLRHKFTNAYRASDRASQYLIRQVIYQGDQSPDEVVFRILLFKLFNKIETWEWLRASLKEEISLCTFSFARYDKALQRAIVAGMPIYSAAYIMPSAGSAFGYREKHRNHLRLLEQMVKDRLASRLQGCKTMQQAYELLKSFPSIGSFLAYQYVTDLNYSTLLSFQETEFVVAGPGARDGIRKCFVDLGARTEEDIIRWAMDQQDDSFQRLGLKFRDLWGRPLQLIDCQNLFCEVDKYARVAHPEVVGLTGRTRIKQIFKRNSNPIEYFYPPKWGINEKIKAQGAAYGRNV